MTPEEYKHGRGSFWVQFTCGAILGIFFGVPLARKFGDSFLFAALIFLAVVGVCALVAGFCAAAGHQAALILQVESMDEMPPNHALQRTRPSRSGCNPRVSWAGSLSLGR